MNTYTPNQGLTPQGQALAAGQPNATNSAPPPGSPSSAYGSDADLNARYAAANATNVNVNSTPYRQGMVQNSSLPGMEQNYDQLAQQLFQYDQANLAPQFQGQNPGTPTDAASFGRVDASPLAMTVGSAGLPASQGIYNMNPKYAYQAQNTQANSLLDLLDTLNKSIGSNLDLTKGIYDTKTSAAEAALKGIYNIMQLKQDAVDKEAARASSGGLAGANQANAEASLLADAQKGATFTDLVKRYVPAGLDAYKIRDIYNKVNYYKKPATESEDDVTAILNGQKPAGQAAAAKAADAKKEGQFAIGVADQIFNSWKKMSSGEKLLSVVPGIDKVPGAAPNYSNTQALFYGDLLEAIRKSGVGGRITQNEINWMHTYLVPQSGDTQQTAQQKITALKQALTKKIQDPNYDIVGASAESGKSFSSAARQQAVNSLKTSGYNDNQIHEYLRRKGIDK